jgi:hypothetical protein
MTNTPRLEHGRTLRDARVLRRVSAPRLPSLVIPVAALLLLAAPMLLTRRALGTDWTNHLWLVWNQGLQIDALLHPSYFVHSDTLGAFYPHYAYYGGTVYTIAGTLAALLGESPIVAYVAVCIAAMAMAYGGWTWLALQAGLRGWRAQAPGLVFVTAAYYLTNVYGRGAWGEFMATSAIPLFLAATISLLRSDRVRLAPAAAFVLSILVLTGSHNITLLWATLVFAPLVVVVLIALPRHGRELSRRRIAAVVGLGALALAANAWFLLPDMMFAGKTASSKLGFEGASVAFLDRPGVVFHPLRYVPPESSTPGLFVQLPVFTFAWALVAVAAGWRAGLSSFWRTLAVGLALMMGVLLALVFFSAPWDVLPRLVRYIQFPYRLHTYVLLCLCGLLIIGLRATTAVGVRRRAELTWALVLVLTFGGALAIWQVWSWRSDPPDIPPASRDEVFRSRTLPPPGWADPGNYRDVSAPVVSVDKDRSSIVFPVGAVARDKIETSVNPPPGPEPIRTNIATGDYLVEISGLEVVGRTADGFMVVRRPPKSQRGALEVSVSPAASAPVVLGAAASVAALLALLALAVVRLRTAPEGPAEELGGWLRSPELDISRRRAAALARRLRLLERVDASWRETAVVGGLLLALGAATFGSHIRDGGFHYDDWANYAYSRYSPNGGLFGAFDVWFDLAGYRPGTALYVPLTHFVLDLHMGWHLAWAVALAAAMSACAYHALRILRVERLHAGVIAVLVLVFPYSDATRLWAVAGLTSFAVTLYLLGVICALQAFGSRGRRAMALHAGALALFLASVLTYELLAAPVALSILLYLVRVPWRTAIRPWLAHVGAVGLVLLFVSSRTNLHEVQSFQDQIEHARQIFDQSLTLLSQAVVPFGLPGRTAVLGLLAGIAACALLVCRLLPAAEEARGELRRWLLVAAGGVVAIAAGYALFVPADPYFSPGQLGIGNRVNGFAALGYVTTVYAMAMTAGWLVFRGLPRTRTWAAVLATTASVFIAVGYVDKVDRDKANWDRAFALEQDLLNTISSKVAEPPPGSMIYLFGHPAFYAPGVPVFAAQWDLDGAVKVHYRDPSLRGLPILAGMRLLCLRDGVTAQDQTVGYRGAKASVPYGRAFAVDAASRTALALDSRSACRAAERRFKPGPAELTRG